MSDNAASIEPGSGEEAYRKVRVRKVVRASAAAAGGSSSSGSGSRGSAGSSSSGARQSPLAGLSQSSGGAAALMDRRFSEVVPALADLSLSGPALAGGREVAREVRLRRLQQEQERAAELLELDDIYDFDRPNPVDTQLPQGTWSQKVKPGAKKIVLSPYQYEMINYQRMLMRKNIWYYRDRMSVPRGPCPLHVLKDCWVQGVIDENTLVWGQGLIDWLPMKNVKLLVAQVRTPEVRLGAWIKRTFSLKPALERIRENRREQRSPEQLSMQVDRMR